MSEDFLHYIWKFQLYDPGKLYSTTGQKLQVQNQGTYNLYSGPDFKQAKIRLDGMLWTGSIEIHKRSSDWLRHRHQFDKKYDNVVLHVVWEHDQEILRTDHTPIPTLELKSRVQQEEERHTVPDPRDWKGQNVPCERYLGDIEPLDYASFLESIVHQRLDRKSQKVQDRLRETGMDWEQVAYESVAYSLGLKINADNFQMLARVTPLNLLRKHADQPIQLEALLFGQSGMLELPGIGEAYFLQLKKEYAHLKSKYGLQTPLQYHHWNYGRLRPASFPTIRIAQLAACIHRLDSIFSTIRETESVKAYIERFSYAISDYWTTHYRFGKTSSHSTGKKMSKVMVHKVIVNAVVPMLVQYAAHKNKDPYKKQAVKLLQELPPEENTLTQFWVSRGFQNRNSMESQALIELNNNYCDRKQCLFCNIGANILQRN